MMNEPRPNPVGSNSDKEMVTMAEEELSRLQRQLRIMEEDRIAFLDETASKLSKQRNVIRVLGKEKDALNEDLQVATCRSYKRKDLMLSKKVESLVQHYESLDKDVKVRKEQLRELEVQIKKNISISKDPIICEICTLKLQESFDFKLNCLNRNDYIKTFVSAKAESPLVLEHVINNMTMCEGDIKLEQQTVCRMCVKYKYTKESTFLEDLDGDVYFKDVMDKSFPEIDFNLTASPMICIECMKSLRDIYNFIVQCSDSDDIIASYMSQKEMEDKNYVDLSRMFEYITDLKTSDTNGPAKDTKDYYMINTCETNQQKELDRTHIWKGPHTTGGFITRCYKIKDISKTIFACNHCPHQTNRKDSLELHLMLHKTSTEVPSFKCQFCDFVTKWKSSLPSHKLKHKNPEEITIYRCANCQYASKYKKHLRRHMKRHENRYKCDICHFQTFLSRDIRKHIEETHNIDEREPITGHSIRARGKRLSVKNTKLKCDSMSNSTTTTITIKSESCKEELVYDDKSLANNEIYIKSEMTDSKEYFNIVDYTGICNVDSIKTSKNNKARGSSSFSYECQCCSYKTHKMCRIKEHLVKHQGKDQIEYEKCKLCPYFAKHRRSIRAHMSKIHNKEG